MFFENYFIFSSSIKKSVLKSTWVILYKIFIGIMDFFEFFSIFG